MKNLLLTNILVISLSISFEIHAQLIEVEGAINIDNTDESAPAPGTIRWTDSNFEGWTRAKWIVLSGIRFEEQVSDVKGNVYSTVLIGNQIWMADKEKSAILLMLPSTFQVVIQKRISR